jgi:hypothetical protein
LLVFFTNKRTNVGALQTLHTSPTPTPNTVVKDLFNN